jgi:hypothetical protein
VISELQFFQVLHLGDRIQVDLLQNDGLVRAA